MKIIIKNNSAQPLPYLLRCSNEKVGYIYYLNPGESFETVSLNTHKDGLLFTTEHDGVISIALVDFPRLEISYVKR